MRGSTALERTRAGALVALLSVPWLLACAQIAGTSDYRVGEESKQVETLPPFLTGPGCEDCANAHCGKQLAACAADQTCSSWLADIRARPDPLSAYERYQTEIGLVWQADHDDQPYDASISNLRSCAQQCLEPCKVGQDFSCVGAFDWDLPPTAALKARATGNNNIPAKVQISACSTADLCDVPLASQVTDESGFSELSLTQDAQARGPVDYLHFTGSSNLPWKWVQTRPLADGDYVPLQFIDRTLFDQWHEAFGQSFESDQGVLIVVPVDCSGIGAKQLTLEAWIYQESKLTFCSDCFYAYAQDTNETPNAELHGYLTTGNAGYIAHVPPGLVYVVLRRVGEPHGIVSVGSLVVQGGEVATVRAYPASQQQVLSLPDPRN